MAFIAAREPAGPIEAPAVPGLPPHGISREDTREALGRLDTRLADHRLDVRDTALRRQLEDLHLAESARDDDRDEKQLRQRFLEFQRAAEKHALLDERRYLLLGDAIARDLQRAFGALLERFARHGLPGPDDPLPDEVRAVERLGGAFLSRMVERGYLLPDGTVSGSELLPEVLFRVRWRMIARFEPLLGITEAEQRAYHHFVMASTPPSELPRRLQTLEQLAAIDEAYDRQLARAVLLHQAGKDEKALEVIRATLADGREADPVLTGFAEALSQ